MSAHTRPPALFTPFSHTRAHTQNPNTSTPTHVLAPRPPTHTPSQLRLPFPDPRPRSRRSARGPLGLRPQHHGLAGLLTSVRTPHMHRPSPLIEAGRAVASASFFIPLSPSSALPTFAASTLSLLQASLSLSLSLSLSNFHPPSQAGADPDRARSAAPEVSGRDPSSGRALGGSKITSTTFFHFR